MRIGQCKVVSTSIRLTAAQLIVCLAFRRASPEENDSFVVHVHLSRFEAASGAAGDGVSLDQFLDLVRVFDLAFYPTLLWSSSYSSGEPPVHSQSMWVRPLL